MWSVLLLLVLMVAAYGYPIAQFFTEPSPEAVVHRIGDQGMADHPQAAATDRSWRIVVTFIVGAILLFAIGVGFLLLAP